MKIIQSFWGGNNKDVRNKYGWFDYNYHWLSWILSCNQLVKFYDNVELYTDKFGYNILINKLKLPYTKVHVVLDVLNDLPSNFWAMAKIKTYSLQEEPFLHIDSDVFIFEPFSKDLIASKLIAQNREIAENYYDEQWKDIQKNLIYIPMEMNNYLSKVNYSYNMGIFGGSDIKFIKKYTEEATNFLFKNLSILEKLNTLNFNLFFEQVLFYVMSQKNDKKVNNLFTESIGENEYIIEFNPESNKYLHLLGSFKKEEYLCKRLEQYCLYNFPHIFTYLKKEIPEKYQNFKIPSNKQENLKLIIWYRSQLLNRKITNKRLIARDLYMNNKISELLEFEEKSEDYYIFLLPEIVIKEDENKKKLYIKEINSVRFIKDLNLLECLIIDELKVKPKLKKIFYTNLLNYLGDDFLETDIVFFKKSVYTLIKQFVELKIISVESQKYYLVNSINKSN